MRYEAIASTSHGFIEGEKIELIIERDSLGYTQFSNGHIAQMLRDNEFRFIPDDGHKERIIAITHLHELAVKNAVIHTVLMEFYKKTLEYAKQENIQISKIQIC